MVEGRALPSSLFAELYADWLEKPLAGQAA
jgi:hypothetical protein